MRRAEWPIQSFPHFPLHLNPPATVAVDVAVRCFRRAGCQWATQICATHESDSGQQYVRYEYPPPDANAVADAVGAALADTLPILWLCQSEYADHTNVFLYVHV